MDGGVGGNRTFPLFYYCYIYIYRYLILVSLISFLGGIGNQAFGYIYIDLLGGGPGPAVGKSPRDWGGGGGGWF